MRHTAIFLLFVLSLNMAAADYDQDKPFGFCTRTSRTDASCTFDVTGGGCYTYPLPNNFAGKVVVLKSTGEDMRKVIENAIEKDENKVIILDGSAGDFIVSANIGITASNKTLLGINNACIRTKWYVTDDIRNALNAAGVPQMSTSGDGGTLPNGRRVREQAEYNTRKIIIEMTGDSDERYRSSGTLSLRGCQNIIIRNITFVGPGSIDVGGNDLISCTNGTKNCWIDHCAFMDGMDGNFDITMKSDFITVSWCTFSYTALSYMHQNTNLIGANDREAPGFLNVTYAFNWWGTGCKQRMPMARVGKIHMLNNYFSSTTASNCMNPRANSEFLIEGNYVEKGVKQYYSQSGAIAVTWTADNFIAEAEKLPESLGSVVTVPYDYTVAPYNDVPTAVTENAGATLFTGEASGIHRIINNSESNARHPFPDFGDASSITTQHIMRIQKHGALLTPSTPKDVSTNIF